MIRDGTRPEIFRGHLEECLHHFSEAVGQQAPKYSKKIGGIRKTIAKFCGVGPEAVAVWLSLKSPTIPAGKQVVKLMCFLDLQGYRIIEFENLESVYRQFAELIGFDIVTGSEVSSLLGYKDNSTIYRILRGTDRAGPDRKDRMWQIWKENKEKLEKEKERILEDSELIMVSSEGEWISHSAIKIMEGLILLFNGIQPRRLSGADRQIVQRLVECLTHLGGGRETKVPVANDLSLFMKGEENVESRTTKGISGRR